jgi:K+-transporting ATPase ATPase C chain
LKEDAMLATLRPALVLLTLFTLVCGVAYPLAVTGFASAAFPRQAGGSLVKANGKIAGSTLIGQPFDDPKYLWGRPSGTTPAYNAGASTGTNYGPGNTARADAIKARTEALRAADATFDIHDDSPVPVDLVTASASGLDPHVSPEAAEYQVRRVARARHVTDDVVRAAVARNSEPRTLGVLGEPHVNVLAVNMALDGIAAE